MIDAIVDIPNGWIVAEPPPGVALVATEPLDRPAPRANLVVTMIDRPAAHDVESYLDAVLGHLLVDLDDAELIDAWTNDAGADQHSERLLLRHSVAGHVVDTVQQHTWFDDTVVIVTVTAPVDLDPERAAALVTCLEPRLAPA